MPGQKRARYAMMLASFAATAGCTTVKSTRIDSYRPEANSAGINYFLPKRLVKLTVTRNPVDAAELIKKRDAKVSERDAAKATFDDFTTKRKDAEAKLKAFKPDPVDAEAAAKEKAKLEKAVEDGKTRENVAKEALKPAESALDRLSIEVAAAQQGGGCSYTAILEAMPFQADPAQRFVADFRHSVLRDDHMAVSVGANGLLASVNLVNTDRTGDIVTEIANIVGTFGGVGGIGRDGRTKDQCAAPPTKFVRIFDPAAELPAPEIFALAALAPVQSVAPQPAGTVQTRHRRGRDQARTESPGDDDDGNTPVPVNRPAPAPVPAASDCSHFIAINKDLCEGGFPIRVAMDATTLASFGDTTRWPRTAGGSPAVTGSGLYYRTPVSAVLTILQKNDFNQWQPVDAAIVPLPQIGPTSFIPLQASMFVKTTSDVTFTDGVPISITRDRPSEALSVLKLPLVVINSLFTSASNVLQLRVNYDTKQSEYRKTIECFEAARLTGGTADDCD